MRESDLRRRGFWGWNRLGQLGVGEKILPDWLGSWRTEVLRLESTNTWGRRSPGDGMKQETCHRQQIQRAKKAFSAHGYFGNPPLSLTSRAEEKYLEQTPKQSSTTMSAASRERKRANDRAAQRANRARAKAYIAQLERTVAELSRSSEQEDPQHSQLLLQQKEIQELKKRLNRVARIAQGSEDSAEFESSAFEKFPTVLDGLGDAAAQPGTSCNQTCSHVTQCTLGGGLDQPTLEVGPDPRSNTNNIFKALSDAILRLKESPGTGHLSGLEEDCHICISVVLFGWEAVERTRPIDSAWRVVREMDQTVFQHAGKVERIGMIRIFRDTLVSTVCSSSNQPRREVPYFMKPSALQDAIEHDILFDFYHWPNFRDYLILNEANYADEEHVKFFATHLRFHWDYDFRDIYRRSKSTGKYSFSEDFNLAYRDLRNWKMLPCVSKVFDLSLFLDPEREPDSLLGGIPPGANSEKITTSNPESSHTTIDPSVL